LEVTDKVSLFLGSGQLLAAVDTGPDHLFVGKKQQDCARAPILAR